MSAGGLGTYLNDHLAGSVMALEMIERSIGQHPGTPLSADLTWVAAEIREEQKVLRELLEGLDVKESPVKKAGAWLAEKAGRLKLGDMAEDPLGRLEMLEALSLGIQGKLKLWMALEQVMARRAALAGVDFRRLQARAREQHDRVEAYRLEAAGEAL